MERRVRVLAVVCQMNLCGLENRLMDIIRRIDYAEIKLDVFSYRLTEGVLDEEIRKYGGVVYYNPPLTVGNMVWYVHYFENFLKEHPEYTIVHAHQDAWCSVFCKGAYLAGVPVRIAHSRTAISVFTLKNLIKNIIKLPARRYATHYFAVSDFAGKWLFGDRNMREGKVQIWKNAIDCQAFRFDPEVREKKRELLDVQNKKVIMHVGNFVPFKNQAFLIDIIQQLSKEEKNSILILVGKETDNGLQKQAKEKIKRSGLSNFVRFLGRRSDVNELLQAADVFCFPSVFEGLPGAVLEAQAAGLPCVISSSITEAVKVLNTTKMVPLEAGISAWCQEIIDSLNTSRRDTYEDMVCAGFDIEKLVDILTKFYQSVGRE